VSAPATPTPAAATPAKQGSRWLRWTLVEAATSAVRDPQLGRFATQIAQRRGPKIARVALARRLLTLCYYALRDERGCRAAHQGWRDAVMACQVTDEGNLAGVAGVR
jgi:hypothetical protein